MQRLMSYRRDGNLLQGYLDHVSPFPATDRAYWAENAALNYQVMRTENGVNLKSYEATGAILGDLAAIMSKVKHGRDTNI